MEGPCACSLSCKTPRKEREGVVIKMLQGMGKQWVGVGSGVDVVTAQPRGSRGS